MDYGALPPEVNSGRMYLGAGPGPMLTAAAAWDGLATDLYTTASCYGALIAELGGVWAGPAAVAMDAAATPYVAWLTATATQAEATAVQAKAAVAAYEAAFAMTVPPPVIAANRAQLMALIATNFFGQNLPAIAVTEAHYAEMWAQDAAAMYGYTAGSAQASALTTFDQPPPATDPVGRAGQAAAVGQAASSSKLWKKLVSMYGNDLGIVFNHLGDYEHMMKVFEGVMPAAGQGASAAARLPGLAMPTGGGPLSAASGVSAAAGNAGRVGRLSVPQSWAAAAPTTNLASTASPISGTGAGAKADGLLRGMPLAPGAGRRAGGEVGQRYGFRHLVVARPVVGG